VIFFYHPPKTSLSIHIDLSRDLYNNKNIEICIWLLPIWVKQKKSVGRRRRSRSWRLGRSPGRPTRERIRERRLSRGLHGNELKRHLEPSMALARESKQQKREKSSASALLQIETDFVSLPDNEKPNYNATFVTRRKQREQSGAAYQVYSNNIKHTSDDQHIYKNKKHKGTNR
jgi:hypothetical protein